MPSRFRHAALVGKYQTAGMRSVLDDVAQFVVRHGLDVALERETAEATGLGGYPVLGPEQIGSSCDLAVVVGGDGTMLAFARRMAPFGVPLVGINQGRLGFITDVSLDGFRDALAPMLGGDYEIEHRSVLDGEVQRDGASIFRAMAVNDVVVSRGAASSMIEVRIDVGDQLVAHMRADGLILASPTGSTAYALSAGGPILHPGIGGWVMVPIAPHTLSNRPIVLPDSAAVSIEIVAGREASAHFDMHGLASLLIGDRIVVHRSQHQVRFLHPRGWSYYATLRRKLHWQSGGVVG